MIYVKADTEVRVCIGPFVDVGDGFTPETGVTLSGADQAELVLYNGSTAQTVTDVSGNTFTAITGCDGYYSMQLTSGQLTAEGPASIIVQDADVCLPVKLDIMVVNANVYDALFAQAATDYLQTDAVQLSGSGTAADNLEGSALAVINGTAATGTLTTTVITTSLSGTYNQDDALNGRVIIFLGDVTADLKGQARLISDYAASGGTITWASALTDAPANNDSFVVV